MTKSHLSRENRYTIQHMLESGKPFADIARAINKNKSTISREVRNHSQENKELLQSTAPLFFLIIY